MEVQHRVEASTSAPLGGAMDVVDEDVEAPLGQGGLRVGVDLARPAHALGFERGVRQHGLRHDLVRPALCQQVQYAVHPGEVLVDVLGTAEAQGQEGPHHREPALA